MYVRRQPEHGPGIETNPVNKEGKQSRNTSDQFLLEESEVQRGNLSSSWLVEEMEDFSMAEEAKSQKTANKGKGSRTSRGSQEEMDSGRRNSVAPYDESGLEPLGRSTQDDNGRGFYFTFPNPYISDIEEEHAASRSRPAAVDDNMDIVKDLDDEHFDRVLRNETRDRNLMLKGNTRTKNDHENAMKQTKNCKVGAILCYLRVDNVLSKVYNKVYNKLLRIRRVTIQAEGNINDTSCSSTESLSVGMPRTASWEAQRLELTVGPVDDLDDEATISSIGSGVV
ncbi:hypothetical protein ARMGADRAFT_1036218 [Armillaria gallica]|uniref:Uncharacterized protein n=1 Tax=Armillaria gallica TaxID=47427 RepID=A0A2H3D4R9_ARMGA|nr:hypothetical protein ARMGADRAFT_1036218 [Armillaria gallica]